MWACERTPRPHDAMPPPATQHEWLILLMQMAKEMRSLYCDTLDAVFQVGGLSGPWAIPCAATPAPRLY